MKRYIVLLALLLAACNTATSASPTPTILPTLAVTPTPPPLPTATATLAPKPPAVEDEIVSFAVDYIVTAEIRDMADFIKNNSGESWMPGPPKASIIIYGPVVNDPEHPEWGPHVNDQQAIKVWWYEDDQLAETDQKTEAMSRYEEQFMATPAADIFAWGYYDFGIASVTEDGRQAELYIGASCGPLCGHGILYKILRESPGKWRIIDQQFLWQS